MTSDFKDVLRERIEGLVKSRMAAVEAAVASAREDIDKVLGGLHETAAAPVTTDDSSTLDQISAEIAAV